MARTREDEPRSLALSIMLIVCFHCLQIKKKHEPAVVDSNKKRTEKTAND